MENNKQITSDYNFADKLTSAPHYIAKKRKSPEKQSDPLFTKNEIDINSAGRPIELAMRWTRSN